jgi:carbamoyl-phosphate synthase small subunit
LKNALLALEDGSVFRGVGFGACASACGEVCFNTSMTGYQEILTDPSYKAQIVTMTYPLIGNYGVNRQDVESWKPHVAGFVVHELSPLVSNWRADASLAEYLAENGVPGIQGIDTRALTKKLRVRGALNGFITTEDLTEAEAVRRARAWPGLVGVDYVREVTHREPFAWDEQDVQSANFRLVQGLEARDPRTVADPLPPADIPIVAYDFGMKYNILRRLRQHGFKTYVVPAGAPASEVLARKPAGVFLSNGPGDPAALGYAVRGASWCGRGCPYSAFAWGTSSSGRRWAARLSSSSSAIAAPIIRSRTSKVAGLKSRRRIMVLPWTPRPCLRTSRSTASISTIRLWKGCGTSRSPCSACSIIRKLRRVRTIPPPCFGSSAS